MTPSIALVVPSQVAIPATKPISAPPIHPHLFALFQVIQSAMGTTAEPSATPMNS